MFIVSIFPIEGVICLLNKKLGKIKNNNEISIFLQNDIQIKQENINSN